MKTYALLLLTFAAALHGEPRFVAGKPVWPAGAERELNYHAGFRAVVEAPLSGAVTLRIAASPVYRVFLNGSFHAFGPARAAHGFYRVDEWDLASKLKRGKNLIAIEVAGYNINSYYLLDQPSFLQAEVVGAGGRVLASTGGSGAQFQAQRLKEVVTKAARYSFQRTFSEVYHLAPGFDRWRSDPDAKVESLAIAVQPGGRLLPRRVGYPRFDVRPALTLVATGTLKAVTPEKLWKDRAVLNISPTLKGFPESALSEEPSLELQRVASASKNEEARAMPPQERLRLAGKTYATVDFGTNLTGFIGATVRCRTRSRLLVSWDEILTNGDVDFKRMGTINILTYQLEPGEYSLESLEPYTLRYAKLVLLEGECSVEDLHVREYANPDVWRAEFRSSDARLNRIFAAARETYRQNSVDLFTDCPSRERAGWLGDSFFTARAAQRFSGDTVVEKAFIENYLLAPKIRDIPEAMLPMAYPADHYDGNFIPTYPFWFLIQMEEYAARSQDRELIEAFRPKILKLFQYYDQFRNSDGLLEKLPKWVFIEWSAANSYVQDVNYPANMMYAAALDAAGRMYKLPELQQRAAQVRAAVQKQSFDGEFYVDNAVRKDGRLTVTRNRTETCQYFAFYFGLASPETQPALWKKLRSEFGPGREKTGKYREIGASNVIFGMMLRFELLSRYGLNQQILDESIASLLYMVERTGTLWEFVDPEASTNHGLASHAAYMLYRDVLGVASVDTGSKEGGGTVPTRQLGVVRREPAHAGWRSDHRMA